MEESGHQEGTGSDLTIQQQAEYVLCIGKGEQQWHLMKKNIKD